MRRRNQNISRESTWAQAPLPKIDAKFQRSLMTMICNIIGIALNVIIFLILFIGFVYVFVVLGYTPITCAVNCNVTTQVPLTDDQLLVANCTATYCQQPCHNASDCPNIDLKDVRVLPSFNAASLRVDKLCGGGACEYYYEIEVLNNINFTDQLRFSQKQRYYYSFNDTYYYPYYENTSFLSYPANRIGTAELNYAPMDPTDPQNFLCRQFLQTEQSYVNVDCIAPLLLYFASSSYGRVLIECVYFIQCGTRVSSFITNETIHFQIPSD